MAGKLDRLNDAPSDHPKYRMIAIDLDGTLLSPAGVVTRRTRSAVQEVLSAGLVVCFATGRNWTESRMALDAVGHYDTGVFVGGAMVIDTKRHVTLHRTLMQPKLAAEVCGFFENRGLAALALQDHAAMGVDYMISSDLPMDDATMQWIRVAQVAVNKIPRLGSHPHGHTVRVGTVAKRERAVAVERDLRDAFGDRLVCHSLALMSQGVDVLEVFDPAVNKWQGLLHVAARHDIRPAEIVAIGDDVNDLPMIRHAGLGVAMGNARADVQAVANRVIGSNADDGLAIFLEELLRDQQIEPRAGGEAA